MLHQRSQWPNRIANWLSLSLKLLQQHYRHKERTPSENQLGPSHHPACPWCQLLSDHSMPLAEGISPFSSDSMIQPCHPAYAVDQTTGDALWHRDCQLR
eukprot:s514_g17.t1